MTLRDPFEGWWLPPNDLAAAVRAVAAKYKADTLVLRPDDFTRISNAIFVHPYGLWIRAEYLKIGIDTIVAKEMPAGVFEVSSGLFADGTHIRDEPTADRIRFVDLDHPIERRGILPPTKGCLLIPAAAIDADEAAAESLAASNEDLSIAEARVALARSKSV